MAKYTRGANFERAVLKHLIGDNTDATQGVLHTYFSDTADSPKIYGIRSAGSRGFFDLVILFTMEHGAGYTLGVQCKIGIQSESRMEQDLRMIQNLTNVRGIYALKEKGNTEPKYYPDLDMVMGETLKHDIIQGY